MPNTRHYPQRTQSDRPARLCTPSCRRAEAEEKHTADTLAAQDEDIDVPGLASSSSDEDDCDSSGDDSDDRELHVVKKVCRVRQIKNDDTRSKEIRVEFQIAWEGWENEPNFKTWEKEENCTHVTIDGYYRTRKNETKSTYTAARHARNPNWLTNNQDDNGNILPEKQATAFMESDKLDDEGKQESGNRIHMQAVTSNLVDLLSTNPLNNVNIGLQENSTPLERRSP